MEFRKIKPARRAGYALMLFTLAILTAGVGLAAALQEQQAEILVPRARVRLNPDLNSDIIRVLEKGTVLKISGESGDWYKVELPKDESGFVVSGYIHKQLVKVGSGAVLPAPVVPALPERIRVIRENAVVRSAPDPGAQVVREIPQGMVLRCQNQAGDWYQVMLPPAAGGEAVGAYIHRDAVEPLRAAGVSSPAPVVQERRRPQRRVQPAVAPPRAPRAQPASGGKLQAGIRAGYGMMIDALYGGGPAFGAVLGYALSPKLGVEVSGFSYQSEVTGDPDGLSDGKLAVMAVQLSLRGSYPLNDKMTPYAVVGANYHLNTFTMDDASANAWEALGFAIDESVDNGIGFHAGLGLDYALQPRLIVNLDARLIMAKVKAAWELTDEISGTQTSEDLDGLDLSAVVITVGLKYCF